MRRIGATVIAALLLPAPSFGQDVGSVELATEPAGSTDAARLGLPASAMPALRTLLEQARQVKQQTLVPGSTAGTRIFVNGDRIEISPAVTRTPGAAIIDPSVIEELRATGAGGPFILFRDDGPSVLEKLAIGIGRDTVQSVDPDLVPSLDDLPASVRGTAAADLPKKPAPSKSACSLAQNAFNNGFEQVLRARGFPVQPSDAATRSAWISQIAAYDTSCLSPVATGSAASGDLPLDRIGIVLNDAGQPICVALHLGDGRFVTARHCFFDPNDGTPRRGRASPKIAMVDGSTAGMAEAQLRTRDPFGQPAAKFGGGTDLIGLIAADLPAAIKQRRLAAADFASATLMGENAVLIGYFPIAKPAARFPADLSAGKPAAWMDALRTTRVAGEDYCRVWARSSTATGAACLEHSCQSIGGFSGAPVFVKRGGRWLVAGLHVAGSDDKTEANCGRFADRSLGQLRQSGAIAAVLPHR